MSKAELGFLVTKAIRAQFPAQVLRGLDSHAREGGDIDIMVPPNKALAACYFAGLSATRQGWLIGGFRDLGYVSSVVFVKPRMGNEAESIKVDFINGFAWYGISASAATSISDTFSGRWKEAIIDFGDSRAIGALTFFQKIMASGFVSQREWSRIKSTGADIHYLKYTADKLDLPLSLEDIVALKIGSLRKWRLRAASSGVNNLAAALSWFSRASFSHIKLKLGLGTGQGLVVGVSGLDGSGKSTLVSELLRIYTDSGFSEPEILHLLPSWIPMPHQIARRRKTFSNYTRPYSEPPVRSSLSGLLRLSYYLSAFLATRWFLYINVMRGKQVVLDRSFVDFSSDLTRARIPQRQLPGWLLERLSPKGLLFYLEASPSVVVERKGELTYEKASSLCESYSKTCKAVNVKRLDGNARREVVFLELLEYLSQEYMRRIRVAGFEEA